MSVSSPHLTQGKRVSRKSVSQEKWSFLLVSLVVSLMKQPMKQLAGFPLITTAYIA